MLASMVFRHHRDSKALNIQQEEKKEKARMSLRLVDLLYHLETVYLFVRSDLKTIMFPVGIFSHVASPSVSWSGVPLVLSWLLLHLLLIDVDNQSLSAHEDKVNKPWRPLPSGRVTESQVKSSLWIIYPACLIVSALANVFVPSAIFAFLVFVYDHGELAGHWFWKNVVNAGGYLSLEIAATMLVAGGAPIDAIGVLALIASGLVILTTIHIQDIQDEAGDRIMGRQTVPIRFGPNISRGSVSLMVMFWSFVLPALWGLPFVARAIVASLGAVISHRNWFIRNSKEADEATYRLFNVWLISIHLLIAPIRLSQYISA